MRKNIAKVIEAFRNGQSAIGDAKRTCATDGKVVLSYDMPIAQRLPDGTVEIVYTGPTRTTRAQVDALHAAFPTARVVEKVCYKYVFVRRGDTWRGAW